MNRTLPAALALGSAVLMAEAKQEEVASHRLQRHLDEEDGDATVQVNGKKVVLKGAEDMQ